MTSLSPLPPHTWKHLGRGSSRRFSLQAPPNGCRGGPQKPPPPPAGPLEQLAKGTTRGPKGGERNWARGWTPDPGRWGRRRGAGCSLSYLHPGSSFHSDDSRAPSSPGGQRKSTSFWPRPKAALPPSRVSGGGSRGLSRGSRLHQGKQQMLYIRPRPSQVLTVYCVPLLMRTRKARGRSWSAEGGGVQAGIYKEGESLLAEVQSSQERQGGEGPGPLVPPRHLSRKQKREVFALSKASHPGENQPQISRLRDGTAAIPRGTHEPNNMPPTNQTPTATSELVQGKGRQAVEASTTTSR